MQSGICAHAVRPVGRIGLAMLILLAGPALALAAPRWCSPFETEGGEPVTTGQIAGPVANAVGEVGQATAGVSDLDPLLYVRHGEFTPAIPSAIDPAGQAAAFAISAPDDRRTGINTNLRSDAGDLANNLTFEGYFYMPVGDLITAPTFVGRRLVTQKRGPTDDSSRLAVGVHSTRTGVVDGLFDYEGFNYEGTTLDGQNGGTGFAGPWTNATTFGHLSDDGVSLDSDIFPFEPAGSRISGKGGTSARPLSRSIDLSAEGTVSYLSALIGKTTTPAGATGHNLEIGLANSATSAGTGATIRIGMTSGHRFFLTNSSAPQGNATAGVAYFVVVKIISHASTPDECFMQVYAPGEAVGTSEPTTWMLTHSLSSSAVLTHLRMTFGANLDKGEIDEIRLGNTFASVVDPQAPLGDAGTVQNVLSVYWAEEVPAEPPALPTYINHLEFGTTPILPGTWYHFATTYDGTALRWYLDGQQQGEVLDPPLAPAGTAKMVLANNRMTGANDRGFYGLLDELRIWDKALAPSAMLPAGGLPGEGLLWRSRFETQFGQPVTTGLAADQINCFTNTAGPPNGSPAGIVASIYQGYGETDVPALPAAIDPAGLGDGFVLSLPDLPNAAVETNIPSNAGDFANAITAQGYFNTFRTTTVGVTAVGSRLVSTMRSAAQGSVRLAVGLAANDDLAPTHNVLSIIWADPDSVLTVVRGTTAIQSNTWYHFAMVYDGTDIRFYLNGQQEGEVLAPNLITPGTGTIVVGNDRGAGTGTRGFYGLLDKIVISDHVLAPGEFMTSGFDPCLGVWCNVPFADFDGDDDVDMLDFAALQRCLTLGGGEIQPGCACFDRDNSAAGDGDIDLLDIEEFLKCATGPSLTWTPELTPGCAP